MEYSAGGEMFYHL